MAKTMASLQAFPSSLLPRAWSRALIPFPFPFERLPRRLGSTVLGVTKLLRICRLKESTIDTKKMTEKANGRHSLKGGKLCFHKHLQCGSMLSFQISIGVP